jgi:hypothetical protein
MKSFIPCLFLLASCSAIHETSDKIEESHYALYKQKVLLVHSLRANKVIFTNPANTRYYYLKGKQYHGKWAPGDTFVIENNLEDFYKLRYFSRHGYSQ